jgi:hypothetical protein
LQDSPGIRDSIIKKDSLPAVVIDTAVSRMPHHDSSWLWPSGLAVNLRNIEWEAMAHNSFFGFSSTPISFHVEERSVHGKEWIFYLIILILLIYAFLKRAFPKYFTDLFRLFFRTTIKQRQIKEQLMQTPLPSMMLNGFYVLCAGLYVSLLLLHYKLDVPGGFWLGLMYCSAGLTVVYFLKFVGLKVVGWLFNMSDAADNYIFIVFVVNKMIAIMLLPFLILLAFSSSPVYDIALTASLCLVAGLYCYRMILTFAAIRNQIRVNPFHFFLYLLAFEIAPLLILYKGLLLFFGITA